MASRDDCPPGSGAKDAPAPHPAEDRADSRRRAFAKPVDLHDAATRAAHFAASLGPADLPGLAALLEQARADATAGSAAIEPSIEASIRFDWHAEPRCVTAQVAIDGYCGLLCQRCLEFVRVDIDVDTTLAIGAGLDEEQLAGVSLVYWEHDGESIKLASLIDELVLLELPMVAVHAAIDECGPLAQRVSGESATGQERQKPFADLRALLDNGQK